MPSDSATATPSATMPLISERVAPQLAEAPLREARQRAERVARGVEDQLGPLRAAGVGERLGRHPAARHRVGERSTSAIDAGRSSNGPIQVSPAVSIWTTPGR